MRHSLRLILSCASLTVLSAAPGFAFDAPFFAVAPIGGEGFSPPRGQRVDPSMEAMCKDVVVPLDEGYGVSGQETRLVCDESR